MPRPLRDHGAGRIRDTLERSPVIIVRSAIFTLTPRVARVGAVLTVTTSLPARILMGFSSARTVTIDAKKRLIHILGIRAWFFKSYRRLNFDEVEHVVYKYSSTWTSWSWHGEVHDLIEMFTVGVKLKASEEVVSIGRFVGEGAVGDFSTWMRGDSLVDVAGTQDDDSRSLVTELCELLAVPLGPAAREPVKDPQGRAWRCESCGRLVAPRPKCLYCGGKAGFVGD